MDKTIIKKSKLHGEITVPGDKSISHRAVMLGSIAKGKTVINGFLNGDDCLSTISCFREMGIQIDVDKTNVTIWGKGLRGLSPPKTILDVGNSGTTIRLMSGILSAQNFCSVISGDSSIQKRPMDRVVNPLKQMGADIQGELIGTSVFAPLTIKPSCINAIEYTLPVASAQVKSGILLASLYTKDDTVIIEPEKTRDHTEIMLNYFGANIKREGNKIVSSPTKELIGKEIHVPGDISSAAYFIVATTICKDSCLAIKNVGINETRIGIINVLRKMGADIVFAEEKTTCTENTADVIVKSSNLNGIIIEGDIIPTLIDEIPIIAVAACFAKGRTIIKDAQELKVKESNRIKTVVTELKNIGADIEETDDGMIINGIGSLKGGFCQSHNDHRIAMSLAIAGLITENETVIKNADCVDISFPNFFQLLENLD